ncbi:MAG: hypothetical protein COA47_15495 [Robiginitomaculum sp.]|nr:MAG: hypothetical protein COA47_15495 [Robiginitomaculum sp.]
MKEVKPCAQKNSYVKNAHIITAFYKQQSRPCAPIEALQSILTLLETLSPMERLISAEQLTLLNQKINTIPTGRQRALKQARDDTFMYLNAVCGWTLPEVKLQQFKDYDHQWMIAICRQGALADSLYACYQQETSHQIKQRGKLSLAWTVLTLMIDVAPLPLSFWCERLNDTAPPEYAQGQITLCITHPKDLSYFDDTEPTSFTRYAMTPLAARVFQQWQQSQTSNTKNVTVNSITKELNQFLAFSIEKTLSPLEWQRIIQVLWLYRFNLPPEVLKDFSDPMRHVSALPRTTFISEQQDTSDDFYDLPKFSNIAPKTRDPQFKHWPHQVLIKHLRSPETPRPAQPDWQSNNLLPRLLFDYVQELNEFGGIKKDNLTLATIYRYSDFKSALSHAPLSFEAASDSDALQAWAERVYDNIKKDSDSQSHMYKFFQFLIQQPLTEHLDLSSFVKPTHNVKVDALSLSAEEVHHLVTLLLAANVSPMQKLFTVVSALLSYYGALRRGEILRLRMQDIRCTSQKSQSFHLEITKTKEGKTKSGKSRTVHVTMPEVAAKLVRMVLSIKKGCTPEQPVIGFENETIFSRALHYLLPITKGLKYLYGKQTRFHHLRHSSVKLVYQQALCLANEGIPETWCDPEHPITSTLLSDQFVKQRFNYWLEGHSFSEMNNMLLFDEIGREIGHSYYATTRLHYLHGMDWVAPAFTSQKRVYTHAELRFIFDMTPNSSDIARVLRKLDPSYAQLSSQDKKYHTPLLSHQTLSKSISRLFAINKDAALIQETYEETHMEGDFWLNLWATSIKDLNDVTHCSAFQWESLSLIHKLQDGSLDFAELSQIWRTFAQYKDLFFNRSQRNAIRVLGEMSLSIDKQKDRLILTCPCNQKVQHALDVLKRSGLRYHCHITLYQNRKRLDSNKWRYIHEHLLNENDTADKVVLPTGKTHLTLSLALPCTDTSLLESFQTWWNTLLTHKEKEI